MSRLMPKATKWHVRPARTQISLGIHPVWSECSLSAWRKLGSLFTHWAHSEDWSDWVDAQAYLSLSWAHSHFVGFVMRQLIFISPVSEIWKPFPFPVCNFVIQQVLENVWNLDNLTFSFRDRRSCSLGLWRIIFVFFECVFTKFLFGWLS